VIPWSDFDFKNCKRNVMFLWKCEQVVWMYCSEFSNERARVERRASFYRARKKQQFSEALSAYLEWIKQAGSFYRIFL
jgi:hypothetical protein